MEIPVDRREVAMPFAKSISRLPLAVVGLIVMVALLWGVSPLKAQTIPSDAHATCTVTPAQFAGWFQTGTASLNGVVNPADSLHFPNIPNCSFYQWAEQMFLWLTSPAPPTYCGGGAHVFDSPAFFDVSPPDATGHRTFFTHACSPLGGVIRFLNLRFAKVGPHGLPIIFDKAGRMLEIESPLIGPGGKPLVLSRSGRLIEIERVVLGKEGKVVFLNRAGQPIPRTKPFFRTPFLQTPSRKTLIVQKFIIGGRPIFVDLSGTVVEVEQGQAVDNAVLETQNGSLAYYGIHVNDVYAYFLTGVADGQITPGTSFPTTSGDLGQVTTFASAHGVTFPDPNALAVEVKTAWVDASTLPDPTNYVTMMATIPTYDASNPNQWTPNGQKTVKLALVGMHVVGSTAGHPEMIWATFEHLGNTPNDQYQYVNTNGQTITVPRTTSGTWLFSASNSNGPFNVAHMFVDLTTGNIVSAPNFTISPSDTMRSKAFGGAFDQTPNPLDPTTAASNTEIISINNSVRGMLAAGDVRGNYFQTGATWTIGGAAPTVSFDGNFANNEVGTSKMANTTMETYFQGSNLFATGTNCFDCHHGITTDAGQCPKPPTFISSLSHIFPCLLPLSTTTMLVHVSVLQGTGLMHKILVTVTNSGTGAPMAGATVTVSDPNTGGRKASGNTAANGTVTLTYSRCFEFDPETRKRFPVPCDGSVQAPEFASVGFDAP